MRAQLPLLSALLTRLRFPVYMGQPVVLAFSLGLELKDSPTLERIRAELRALGAALLLVSETQVFAFHPDDEVDSFGSTIALESDSLAELRAACGLSTPAASPRELSLLIVASDGLVALHRTIASDDGLLALADGLTAAGRDALDPRHSLTLSRREVVLASLVGAFALLATGGCHEPAANRAPSPPPSKKTAQTRKITLNVNGAPHDLELEPRVSLLDALRERLALTGSKKGCDHGQCGACTVHVGGRRVNACLTLAVMVGDAPVVTIEGLAQGESLHPMQEAFIGEDALQCGYCTPGQIMSAVGLVRENRAHTDAEVREHMSGNICRCGAYPNIIAAIQKARVRTGHG